MRISESASSASLREQADPDARRGEELACRAGIERLLACASRTRDATDSATSMPASGAGMAPVPALEVGQEQEELVPALAGDQVRLAGARAQAIGELAIRSSSPA